MKTSRSTEEQMVEILRESDKAPVPEMARRHRVSEQTNYTWRKSFGVLEPADVKRLQVPRRMLVAGMVPQPDSSTRRHQCLAPALQSRPSAPETEWPDTDRVQIALPFHTSEAVLQL